jgi:hypothetical protein
VFRNREEGENSAECVVMCVMRKHEAGAAQRNAVLRSAGERFEGARDRESAAFLGCVPV